MEEETKLEELKIEAEFLQRQKEADLTAKQVQLQIEMEKSAAKLKIYKDYPVGTRCCCNVAIRLQSDRDVAQHKSNIAATSSLQRYLYVVSATL